MNKEVLLATLAALAAGCNFEKKSSLDKKLETLPPPVKHEDENPGALCYYYSDDLSRTEIICPACDARTFWPKNFKPTPAWQPCAACHGKEGAS